MTGYLAGVALGLVLILPIGVQNLFVLNQGLLHGFPRVLLAVAVASSCDALLILIGAAGASTLLILAPALRTGLIVVGVVFLLVLGVMTLRSRPESLRVGQTSSAGAMLAQSVGVSLLNPHAIVDTVGVIGGAIAAQQSGQRAYFVAGAISASGLWFLFLGMTASLLESRLTAAVRRRVQQASGALMLGFAALLALQLS